MPSLISRRHLLQSGSAASLVGLSRASRAAAPLPVKIANASGALNQTMAELMRQQRFLESFGLAPEIMTVADGTKILAGIVSGGVDLSLLSGFGQVFPAIEHGGGLKIIAGGVLAPTLAMFTGKNNINSLKDLEGKTVGTSAIGALQYQQVVALLRKKNVDTSKVTFVNVGSSEVVLGAVAAGTVDAGAGAAAMMADAAKFHIRPIPGGNMVTELPDFAVQAAWTSDHAIQTKRDVLVRTLAAYAKLYRFVQSPQAKDPFMNARRKMFPRESDVDRNAEWDFLQKYKPFAVDLVISPEKLRYVQGLNVDFHVQKSVLPFEKVADMSLAQDALKLLR